MGNLKLKTKFIGLMAILLLVALLANNGWTSMNKRTQMQNELREQGRALSMQMDAVWEFMVSNQSRLEAVSFTEKGVYQGLHCAIAGRSIGNLFSAKTEYTTRFVNFNPRNSAAEPDVWESKALSAFIGDATRHEYYGFEEFNNKEVFRYSAPMTIEKDCLQCHGEPVGELDVTGSPKEGWTIGDIGGAISIVIPLDVYKESERTSILHEAVFFVVLIFVCLITMYFGITFMVMRPLESIQRSMEQVKRGNLEVELEQTQSSVEMNALMSEFTSMANELQDIYESLESQVSERTSQLAERTTQLEDRTVELAAANGVLERQRTQLEEANLRLKDENLYKSEFLSMMSHELRTPLTSIVAFAEMLKNEGAPATDKETQTRNEIEYNSRILLTMIEDILEMSRLDAGRAEMAIEVVDLGDVVNMVQGVIQPLARRNGVQFSVNIASDMPLLNADFDKLRHVIENLCGNAVKFTNRGGTVELNAVWEAATDEVLISVRDTGIGIAKTSQKQIFEKFVQVDSGTSRHYNGTGLGLSLAKEYTEMHGGSIEVESELGKGSVFTIRMARDCSQAEER